MLLASPPMLFISFLACLLPLSCSLSQGSGRVRQESDEPRQKTHTEVMELDYRAFLQLSRGKAQLERERTFNESQHLEPVNPQERKQDAQDEKQSEIDGEDHSEDEDSGPDADKDGDGKDDSGDEGPEVLPEATHPTNPPPNPFADHGCESEPMCQGKGDNLVEDPHCWNCYQSYRTVLCEKKALVEPKALWDDRCGKEGPTRQLYCNKFSEAEPPELHAPCFFEASTYAVSFCQKSYKTGFVEECAADRDLGDGYCKEFGNQGEAYEHCGAPGRERPGFMQAYCDKLSKDAHYDGNCAKAEMLGGLYCGAFAEEASLREECVQHESYLGEFCDKKATQSIAETVCAKDPRISGSYCNQLAMKKEKMDLCWEVEEFAQVYCHEVSFDDPKCLEVKGVGPPEERTLDQVAGDSTETLTPHGSTNKAETNSSTHVTLSGSEQPAKGPIEGSTVLPSVKATNATGANLEEADARQQPRQTGHAHKKSAKLRPPVLIRTENGRHVFDGAPSSQ